jgi:hypothetical protein
MSPKALYATLYLACIPLFACVYYLLLPTSFYHSTVQFEYPTMNRAANGILEGIRASIAKRIGSQPKAAACGNWRIDPESVRVSSLDAREGKVSFSVSGQSSTEAIGHAEYYFSERLSVTLNQRMITKPPDGEATVYFLPIQENLTAPAVGPLGKFDLPGCLLPGDAEFPAPFLRVPMTLSEQMRDFAVAVRGFPSKIPGQFWRMVYFSATTITTLGFGDIVPLTTTARMVVSLESVLGIVLMGLFLNAVGNQIGRSRSQFQNKGPIPVLKQRNGPDDAP